MRFHGSRADGQLHADFLVGLAVGEMAEHLSLARRQRAARRFVVRGRLNALRATRRSCTRAGVIDPGFIDERFDGLHQRLLRIRLNWQGK